MNNLNLYLYIDYNTNISFINRAWLRKHYLLCKIYHIEVLVSIKRIGGVQESYKYAVFNIYIPVYTVDGTKKIIVLSWGIQIINDLTANLLIAMNIIGEEVINTLINKK